MHQSASRSSPVSRSKPRPEWEAGQVHASRHQQVAGDESRRPVADLGPREPLPEQVAVGPAVAVEHEQRAIQHVRSGRRQQPRDVPQLGERGQRIREVASVEAHYPVGHRDEDAGARPPWLEPIARVVEGAVADQRFHRAEPARLARRAGPSRGGIGRDDGLAVPQAEGQLIRFGHRPRRLVRLGHPVRRGVRRTCAAAPEPLLPLPPPRPPPEPCAARQRS